ncbi:MAG TPA: membrane protein insertase YidC [Candidatus Merdivicinus intestinigallinarum]|nr:membrane protein insertase YidC [Candidatus Merdivicinus intestinigallinarum]
MTELFGYPLGWIMWLLYTIIPNYGICLILFTVMVRAILFPLSIKQQKSSAKMSVFQPKMAEIQKKYANNKEKQQEEMMKLYQDHGYNPMSGCLPLLIQFPILFGIIDVVYNPLKHILRIPSDVITQLTDIVSQHMEMFNPSQAQLQIVSAIQNPDNLSWFSSISTEYVDKIANFDYSLFGLNLGIVPEMSLNWMLLVPILSGVTSFLVSYISMKTNPSMETNQQSGCMMKGMMYGMPLFSVWIAFTVPVGVGIYWIVSNVLAGAQSIILNKMYSPSRYKAEYEQKMQEVEEQKRLEREKRRKKKLERGEELAEEDMTEEELKQLKKARREQRKEDPNRNPEEEYMTSKEQARRRLAEARRRDAEKYGEEYHEVTDKDLM